MSVTRWDVFVDGCYADGACQAGIAHEAHEEGDWVKWEDCADMQDELDYLRRFEEAVKRAIAPLGVYYMDPPDGGGVEPPEFIERAVAHLLELRAREASEVAR